MSILETTFQYYSANIKLVKPLGYVTLDRFIKAIKSPRKELREVYDRIEKATIEKNEKLRSELKTSLYSFTPSVRVHKIRNYENIDSFTGLMPFDFDKVDDAPEFRDALFDHYPFIVACWLSASRKGVRGIVRIPFVKNTDEFKDYFHGLSDDFDLYHGFDFAPQNAVLPLFLSYDPDLRFREDAVVFRRKKVRPVKPPQFIPEVVNEDEDYVLRFVRPMIEGISSNGHPQLRSASLLMGGFVGGGKIQKDRAIYYLDRLIDSNEYLSQKANKYKKTARWSVERGMSRPIVK